MGIRRRNALMALTPVLCCLTGCSYVAQRAELVNVQPTIAFTRSDCKILGKAEGSGSSFMVFPFNFLALLFLDGQPFKGNPESSINDAKADVIAKYPDSDYILQPHVTSSWSNYILFSCSQATVTGVAVKFNLLTDDERRTMDLHEGTPAAVPPADKPVPAVSAPAATPATAPAYGAAAGQPDAAPK